MHDNDGGDLAAIHLLSTISNSVYGGDISKSNVASGIITNTTRRWCIQFD